VAVLVSTRISAELDARAWLRRYVPATLGLRNLDGLIDEAVL